MTQQHSIAEAAADTARPSEEDRTSNIAELEAEIDQTRNAISGDLRTLGERLDPTHLKQEAKEVIVEAKNAAVETLHEAKDVASNTIREAKDTALNTVNEKVDELRHDVRVAEQQAVGFLRENAIPLALIGLGIGWFVKNRRGSERTWEGGYGRGDGAWRYPPRRGFHPVDDARSQASRLAGGVQDAAAHAKERANRWVDTTSQQASEAAGRARGMAEREIDQLGAAARGAEQRLSEAAYRARDFAGRELRQARELTETHPLAIGAAALAAGIGIGLLLPTTRPEQELLGERKERLFDDAKQAARHIADDAKSAARNVKQSLTGTAG